MKHEQYKNVTIMEHPLIIHKISKMRDEKTGCKEFREYVNEIAMLMGYEVTRDLPLHDVKIQTPIAVADAKEIDGKRLAIVPILRAGLGMVDGMLSLMPNVKVGHIGLYRDHETLQPVEYYCKLPDDISSRDVIVVDPMLATGVSSIAAIKFIKDRGVKHIKFVCIVAAPEGIKALAEAYPDVEIYCGVVDKALNENGYIIPGLGDAGDRIFGTK
ncbi:MAG: uracil phosphoribosyltransferase [Clostridia bacterium]|nr:uracil phosphoribosyltransferase [Clostridia bacterium]